MVGRLPVVGAAAHMVGGLRHDIPVVPPNVQPRGQPHPVAHPIHGWTLENQVPAATPCQLLPALGQGAVIRLQHGDGFLPRLPVHIDDHQARGPAGDDAHVCLGPPPPPIPDLGRVLGGPVQAVGEPGVLAR